MRVSKANLKSEHLSQHVDYVRINAEGNVIGRNGEKILSSKGGKLGSVGEAHIPLSEWLEWGSWNKP